jgi:hypothetical protein
MWYILKLIEQTQLAHQDCECNGKLLNNNNIAIVQLTNMFSLVIQQYVRTSGLFNNNNTHNGTATMAPMRMSGRNSGNSR